MATNCIARFKELKRSPSVEKFRNLIRKQYKENLKEGKNKELNRRRALFHSTVSHVHNRLSVGEKLILDHDLPNLDEMIELFQEIEDELNHNDFEKKVAQRDLDVENETNALLNNEPSVCSWCSINRQILTKIVDEDVCEHCLELYFNA